MDGSSARTAVVIRMADVRRRARRRAAPTGASLPVRERPDPWDLVLLGRAREAGVAHVARLVCSLPMNWRARMSFFDLTEDEAREVVRTRRAMAGNGFTAETVRLVLGIGPVELNMLVKQGLIPMLGTVPPEWGTENRLPRARWPKMFDRRRVMQMAADGEVAEWRRHRAVRRAFLRHGLREVNGADPRP